mmetsp:Transcript_16053/g.37875  ORF Transcript_16053/g.37875 Transcript_16053/m.37875 type:complete len:258 (+) Transcript_16053:116-889(+)
MPILPCEGSGNSSIQPDGANTTAGGALPAHHQALPRALQAVVFDFDATLTIREGLQVFRLFPERGSGGAIDIRWLQTEGFGGERRLHALGLMLQALTQMGVELHIVSMADRDVIVRALSVLGAIHFFRHRIAGWQDLGDADTKQLYIRDLMTERGWNRHEVLFIDDQERNIEELDAVCLTHRTGPRGMNVDEMDALAQVAAGSPIGLLTKASRLTSEASRGSGSQPVPQAFAAERGGTGVSKVIGSESRLARKAVPY